MDHNYTRPKNLARENINGFSYLAINGLAI
jgi:hypothetical protein